MRAWSRPETLHAIPVSAVTHGASKVVCPAELSTKSMEPESKSPVLGQTQLASRIPSLQLNAPARRRAGALTLSGLLFSHTLNCGERGTLIGAAKRKSARAK